MRERDAADRAGRYEELREAGRRIFGAEATEAERTDREEQLRARGGTIVKEKPSPPAR